MSISAKLGNTLIKQRLLNGLQNEDNQRHSQLGARTSVTDNLILGKIGENYNLNKLQGARQADNTKRNNRPALNNNNVENTRQNSIFDTLNEYTQVRVDSPFSTNRNERHNNVYEAGTSIIDNIIKQKINQNTTINKSQNDINQSEEEINIEEYVNLTKNKYLNKTKNDKNIAYNKKHNHQKFGLSINFDDYIQKNLQTDTLEAKEYCSNVQYSATANAKGLAKGSSKYLGKIVDAIEYITDIIDSDGLSDALYGIILDVLENILPKALVLWFIPSSTSSTDTISARDEALRNGLRHLKEDALRHAGYSVVTVQRSFYNSGKISQKEYDTWLDNLYREVFGAQHYDDGRYGR